MSTYTLSLEDEYDYEDYAFVACSTNLKNYQLAASLNRCMGWDLHRIAVAADSPQAALPIYYHRDDAAELSFFLIDVWSYQGLTTTLSQSLQGCDKIVIINGMRSHEYSRRIYDGICNPRRCAADADALQRAEAQAWQALAEQIIDINYFDYSDSLYPESSQWGGMFPEGASNVLSRRAKGIKVFFDDLLSLTEVCVDAYEKECHGDQ
ncbi:MAG: hypothetical protein IJ620_06645 [Bacteroidales bacterium]|nr:hypothetical protein [Bacteroidales bacterium]